MDLDNGFDGGPVQSFGPNPPAQVELAGDRRRRGHCLCRFDTHASQKELSGMEDAAISRVSVETPDVPSLLCPRFGA